MTDHESHGDGLISFVLLKGLAERGHEIFAFTDHAAIREKPERLHVREEHSRISAHSLSPWEQSLRAEHWLRQLMSKRRIDLVWRMHPFGALPYRLPTYGKPLVIGPIFYSWPTTVAVQATTGKPRLGIGLKPLVWPLLERGWKRSLERASLVMCATSRHAASLQSEASAARVVALPVIVDPPAGLSLRRSESGSLRLVFVANLNSYKNPHLFCELVQALRARGLPAKGRLIGDGPERQQLEAKCAASGVSEWIQFAGRLPNDQVWAELRNADLLVSTSHGEPYGRGIAEAMAVGTPAVCHRSGGPPDFICDSVDGLLVDRLDAASYADKIRSAVLDNSLPALAQGALSKAREWTEERVIAQLEIELDSLRSRVPHGTSPHP